MVIERSFDELLYDIYLDLKNLKKIADLPPY